jgi:hypothetical protein
VTKRIIQVILIIAAIALIIYAYFNITDKKETTGDPFELITPQTGLIMEISDMSALDDYNQIIREIAGSTNVIAGVSFNPAAEWYGIIQKLDSLRGNNNLWFNTLSKSPLILCSNEQGRSDVWYMAIGLGNVSSDETEEMMNSWDQEVSTRDFKKQKIHISSKLQWTVLNQCLVMASTSSVIEDVVIQAAADKKAAREELLQNARQISSRDIPLHFYASDIENSWIQLDPLWIDNQTVLSGYRIALDSSANSLSLSSGGTPPAIQNTLPANTSYIDNYSYSDFEAGWRMHEAYFSETEKARFWSQAWKAMGDSCNCDLNAAMLSWRSGEWGTAVMTLSDSSTAEVAYFGINDSINVISLLQPVLDHSPDKADGIYKIKYPQLFERNQPEGILIEHNYVIQHNGYLFAASTPGDLRAVRNSGATLAQDDCFRQSRKPLTQSSGRLIYRKDFYAAPIPSILRQMLSGFSCISMTAESGQNDRTLIYLSLPIVRATGMAETTDRPAPESASDKPADIAQGPWSVTNHKTGGKEEVFVNKNNELCLIGEDGNVLWKKNIGSEIIGKVQQIDALNNGKLQLVFTTESSLNLVDRNGNDVTGFPVTVESAITSPLLIADYDNNKKYRLIFAKADGSIANVSSVGKTTEGWKNPSANGIIKHILHLKSGNEDALVTVSATGLIGIYKRNGEEKQKTTTVLEGYDGGEVELKAGATLGECKIKYTNKSGESKTLQLLN